MINAEFYFKNGTFHSCGLFTLSKLPTTGDHVMKKVLYTLLMTTVLALPAVTASAAGDNAKNSMIYGRVNSHDRATMEHRRDRDWRHLDRSEVQSVQQTLADGGFYRSGVDGRWGPITMAALRDFQKANGLKATGWLDRDTIDELGLQISASDQLTMRGRTPVIWNKDTQPERQADNRMINDRRMARDNMMNDRFDLDGDGIVNTVTTSYGTKLNRSEIQAIQQTLSDASFYRGRVDGYWDAETSRALSSFQIANGLAGTGTLNVLTEKELGLQLSASNQVVPPGERPMMNRNARRYERTDAAPVYVEPASGPYTSQIDNSGY
jgi:peptidoglycan hydrolase-like protein with peptidoglycan-binding domain